MKPISYQRKFFINLCINLFFRKPVSKFDTYSSYKNFKKQKLNVKNTVV